jgi:hypothetical protein
MSIQKLSQKLSQSRISQKFSYFLPIALVSCSLAIALPVIAQSIPNQISSPNIIYVNPQTGSDRPESGSNSQPFKTITYAITRSQISQPTIIQLADGKYSKLTGEKFPIRLRPNITLRGNETNKGNFLE